MSRLATLGAITTAALLLAACEAPTVTRAAPTPLFNKSGEALCRPEQRPISSNYPARLPVCEDICEGRYQVTNVADYVICPPVVIPRQPSVPDDDDDDPGRQPGGQQTGGQQTGP